MTPGPAGGGAAVRTKLRGRAPELPCAEEIQTAAPPTHGRQSAPSPPGNKAGLSFDWRRERAARSYWPERRSLGRRVEAERVIRRREAAAILCGR